MKNVETTQRMGRIDEKSMERGKEQPQADYSRDRFLREYIEGMTAEEQVACFVLLDVADSPLNIPNCAVGQMSVGKRARFLLWQSVKDYAQKSGWEADFLSHNCPEGLTKIHAFLNFWRQQMEAAEGQSETQKEL